jgi:hypothetical protein
MSLLGKNGIGGRRFLNRCCAYGYLIESKLLARGTKRVFPQHRREADIPPYRSHVCTEAQGFGPIGTGS